MADILGQLMNYLEANQTDPLTYLVVFFLFSVAAAIFLPIPIEIGLVWNPGLFFPLKALDLGLGKAVGAIAVFFIPSKVGAAARRLSRWGPIKHLRALLGAAGEKSGFDKSQLYKRLRRRRLAASVAPAPPKWGWLRWLSRKSEGFARRYGVIAMYVIMSVPGMIDTIPLYIFSIINKERTLISLRDFALANFLAGINRAFIIFALLELLGIRLF
jgi:hypothetical protein